MSFTFLAVMDTSGSMLERPIAAANSALNEIRFSLREIQRETGIPVFLGVLSFHESAQWECKPAPIEDFPDARCAVNKKEGCPFYPFTLYQALYNGLADVVSSEDFFPYRNSVLYVCLMTDGQAVDGDEVSAESALRLDILRNARRYVLLIGDDNAADARKRLLSFTGDYPQRALPVGQVTTLLTSLRMEAKELSAQSGAWGPFGDIYPIKQARPS